MFSIFYLSFFSIKVHSRCCQTLFEISLSAEENVFFANITLKRHVKKYNISFQLKKCGVDATIFFKGDPYIYFTKDKPSGFKYFLIKITSFIRHKRIRQTT